MAVMAKKLGKVYLQQTRPIPKVTNVMVKLRLLLNLLLPNHLGISEKQCVCIV
jgi:hypothetical protein